jgi:RimJ/RimL family protein N-acetyltransferase
MRVSTANLDSQGKQVPSAAPSISIQQKPEYFTFINEILNVRFDPAQSVCIASLDQHGEPIGVVVFSRFSVCNCELSVASTTPKFLTRKFLKVLFHYAFITAGKRRITAVIEDGNINALDMDKRLGFVEEARLKAWYGEKDGIMLRMLREECAWL